jgi:hypothetical protein
MGSTTRRRGVYGGKYTPTGLRLFAWWKKNGKRRLQKPGSGSAGIRLYQTGGAPVPFIAGLTWIRGRSNLTLPTTHAIPRSAASNDRSRSIVRVLRQAAGPKRPKAQPCTWPRGPCHARIACNALAACSVRCFLFSFFSFFISSK